MIMGTELDILDKETIDRVESHMRALWITKDMNIIFYVGDCHNIDIGNKIPWNKIEPTPNVLDARQGRIYQYNNKIQIIKLPFLEEILMDIFDEEEPTKYNHCPYGGKI